MSLVGSVSLALRCRCEAISTEQRALLGLRAFDPLPASLLADKLGALVQTPEQFPALSKDQITCLLRRNQWSAAIVSRNPLWIVINPNRTRARYESDLMHELSHVLLNHPMARFDAATGLPVRSQVHENEAAFLGSCLQIPKRGLLWARQQGWPNRQIAVHFGASEVMVSFRLNMTSIAGTRRPPH